MSEIIELIKTLRDRTGAGMMDCKRALEANGNDIEKAIDWLREKGIAKAAKKEGRIAAEGLTIVKFCDKCNHALILEINCETDFVAGSDVFKELVQAVAKLLMHEKINDLDKAMTASKPLFDDAALKLGEKLSFRRLETFDVAPDNGVGTYIHMGGKISSIVVLQSKNEELAKGIAMSIAANSPVYITLNDVPQEDREKETIVQTELVKNDEKLKGKPVQALQKIIEGKVNKVLATSTLSEQEYVLDPSKTIAQVLLENNNKVIKFVRYQVGEGIEKRVDNFVEEVTKQIH